MVQHSKLQQQVLALYRECLRVARSKPGATKYIKQEFRNNMMIAKTEVMRIETLLRRGQRQLESLRKSTTTGIGLFQSQTNDESHTERQ
jgi:succinate dehydrogenase assembly factor 1